MEPRIQQLDMHSFAIADLWNAEVTGNFAASGAAIYLAHDNCCNTLSVGSHLQINRTRPPDAQPCPPAAPCGAIRANHARTFEGDPTDGAVIQLQRGAIARIGSHSAGLSLSGNTGGRLIDVQPEIATAEGVNNTEIVNVLMVDNALSQHLLRAQQVRVLVSDSTIAGNQIGSGDVLAVNADIALQRSILWQPGLRSLSQTGGTRTVASTITSEAQSLGGAPFAHEVDPRFMDPERGDYQLQTASPAVDLILDLPGNDATGAPRGVDMDPKPDGEGPRDAGALERQHFDPLVRNGQFLEDFRLWQVVPPALVEHTTASFGSVRISDGANLELREVAGLRQCVPLPGPGFYVIRGSAYGEGQFALSRDRVAIRWRYVPQAISDDCDGLAVAQGEVRFPLGDGQTFLPPADPPAIFQVLPQEFGARSQLEIALVVFDGDAIGATPTAGHFSVVSVSRAVASAALFRDGFEPCPERAALRRGRVDARIAFLAASHRARGHAWKPVASA